MQGKVPTLPPEVKEPSTSRSQILDDGGGGCGNYFCDGRQRRRNAERGNALLRL
jgi:hypothetical protein